MGYTTIADHYYRNVPPGVFLDGARMGIVAYLRGRGVTDPQVGFMHALPDGRGVVPAIEQQLGRAIDRYGARVDPRELVHSTIRGEVAALRDPYSVFFDRSQLARFTGALDGKPFGGVGIVVAFEAAGVRGGRRFRRQSGDTRGAGGRRPHRLGRRHTRRRP